MYDKVLGNIDEIQLPKRFVDSDHVFHQYTMRVKNDKRDDLKNYLADNDIPSMIYYPVPLYHQNAFKAFHDGSELPVTELLCKQVLSLPIHTEMNKEQLNHICAHVKIFFE